jgi:hypothetical protein
VIPNRSPEHETTVKKKCSKNDLLKKSAIKIYLSEDRFDGIFMLFRLSFDPPRPFLARPRPVDTFQFSIHSPDRAIPIKRRSQPSAEPIGTPDLTQKPIA